jgi:hypothetical protein
VKSAIEVDINIDNGHNNCRTAVKEGLGAFIRLIVFSVPTYFRTVHPSQKKMWYEWLLHNMGNVIAMASVLAFFVYIFSITGTSAFQSDKPTKVKPILEFLKIIQEGSQQLGSYLTQKFPIHNLGASHTHTIVFALLAIALLVFIDRIAGHFFRQLKA